MKKAPIFGTKQFLPFLLLIMSLQLSAQELQGFINYYQGNKIDTSTSIPLKKSVIKDKKQNRWSIDITSNVIDSKNKIVDYCVKYTLLSEIANQVALGVNFNFTNWSKANFVFIPSIVYAGNRFERKAMEYPPYWYDKDEWKVDMPTTTPSVPSLDKYENSGRIELTTGNAATPLMAFYSPNDKTSWMVQTLQGNRYGDFGLFVNEDKLKHEAVFSIMSPAVREKRATSSGFTDSEDKAVDLKKGDVIELKFRLYKQKNSSLRGMYNCFLQHRKDLNSVSETYSVMPFSEVWRVMDRLYQKDRWEESLQMYCITKYNPNHNWSSIWQLGWVGGGQSTLPILLQGKDMEVKRAIQNLNVIFEKTQAPSGLYYAYGNGKQFKGFGFGSAFPNNETFVRSQGDFLYMAQLQFNKLRRLHIEIPSTWYESLKRQADAFLNIWEEYKQVGQFVDVETGKICIGGSTAGAIVPAGLALAYQTYHDKKYLNGAEGLAEKFHKEYVLKGYTTGGPAEILSSPDSESAFALFESYIVLYEVTKDRKWLNYASDLLPICASWVVSYDFEFPKYSVMHQINAHSTGAVWASIANKHAAPAICTWSGESLLKYYRATGDVYAIDLLKDIAHGLPQYISHEDRLIAKMEPGGACERVNLSDWEGRRNVGGNLFASCAWVEVSAMLTVTQLPSIYVRKDSGFVEVFDHVVLKSKKKEGQQLILDLQNPTAYDADLKIYVDESTSSMSKPFDIEDLKKVKRVIVKAKSNLTVEL